MIVFMMWRKEVLLEWSRLLICNKNRSKLMLVHLKKNPTLEDPPEISVKRSSGRAPQRYGLWTSSSRSEEHDIFRQDED
jgi:hypothetical protein